MQDEAQHEHVVAIGHRYSSFPLNYFPSGNPQMIGEFLLSEMIRSSAFFQNNRNVFSTITFHELKIASCLKFYNHGKCWVNPTFCKNGQANKKSRGGLQFFVVRVRAKLNICILDYTRKIKFWCRIFLWAVDKSAPAQIVDLFLNGFL